MAKLKMVASEDLRTTLRDETRDGLGHLRALQTSESERRTEDKNSDNREWDRNTSVQGLL